ncbi:MAG: hypothetical protein C4293_12995 [Nitrospiraceae bacterium]
MENGSSSLYWYALRTKSRFEKVVRGELMRRGIEQLLPTITRTSQWKDRKKQIEWPLFPGVLFCEVFHRAETHRPSDARHHRDRRWGKSARAN